MSHIYKVLLTNQRASTGFTFSHSWRQRRPRRRRLLIRSMNQSHSHTDGAASGDIRASVPCSRTLGRINFKDWDGTGNLATGRWLYHQNRSQKGSFIPDDFETFQSFQKKIDISFRQQVTEDSDSFVNMSVKHVGLCVCRCFRSHQVSGDEGSDEEAHVHVNGMAAMLSDLGQTR